jgi:hypothetical protein
VTGALLAVADGTKPVSRQLRMLRMRIRVEISTYVEGDATAWLVHSLDVSGFIAAGPDRGTAMALAAEGLEALLGQPVELTG